MEKEVLAAVNNADESQLRESNRALVDCFGADDAEDFCPKNFELAGNTGVNFETNGGSREKMQDMGLEEDSLNIGNGLKLTDINLGPIEEIKEREENNEWGQQIYN